jgi:hypothetical protein
MPDYMLLLYQPDAEEGEGRPEDRWAEMPVWLERRGACRTRAPAGGADRRLRPSRRLTAARHRAAHDRRVQTSAGAASVQRGHRRAAHRPCGG